MKTEIEVLRTRLEQTLTSRSKDIRESIAQIETTGSLLDDYLVPVRNLPFSIGSRGVIVDIEDNPFEIHDHAIRQIAEKFGIPTAFLSSLASGDEWKRNVASNMMQRFAENVARERALLRTVNNEVRGFLSDKYRRLDSMQIFIAFLQAAEASGSVLVDAHAGETKGYLEVIRPEIIPFETPINGKNYAVFGARLRNSDFGDGALELKVFMLMVRCLNGLTGESILKEVHLGGKISADFTISQDTYQKDTLAKAGYVRDAMTQLYLPENTGRMLAKISKADSELIDITESVKKLPKMGVSVSEAEKVEKVLLSNDPDDGVEGRPTLWKLVNGLTAVARDSKPERKRELEDIASNLLK